MVANRARSVDRLVLKAQELALLLDPEEHHSIRKPRWAHRAPWAEHPVERLTRWVELPWAQAEHLMPWAELLMSAAERRLEVLPVAAVVVRTE